MNTYTFLVMGLAATAVLLVVFAYLLEYCPIIGILYGTLLFSGVVWLYVNAQAVNLWLQSLTTQTS